MLPSPTVATIETMNVSTDWRHAFHTYYDHNLFRLVQFGFTQQNIVVIIDDIETERGMEISNGKESLLVMH